MNKVITQEIEKLENKVKEILLHNFLAKSGSDNLFENTLTEEQQSELKTIQSRISLLKERAKQEAEESKKEDKASYRIVYMQYLYPFSGHHGRNISNANAGIIVKTNPDGTILFSKELHRTPNYWEKGMKPDGETFEEKVARSTFITRLEFEKTTLSEKWGVPGEMFSVIPKEERFKLISHYVKPWKIKSCLGYEQEEGNETKQATVDLLTGGGTYFSGQDLKTMKENIAKAICAKTLDEEIRALREFDFFYKERQETFVLMDDVPDCWRNFTRGNMLKGKEEHTLDYWREQLLKKYGFENVDFSKADAGRRG